MHKRSTIGILIAALLGGCTGLPSDSGEFVDLGDSQRVTRLFAYPNNCNVICYRNWTLEQTVQHYLDQSLKRDGYPAASVRVERRDDRVLAYFDGTPPGYGQPLRQLLDAGDLAYQGATQLNRDGKWQYNWYFFLPLGMALESRRSVELLHFPPDYSLTQAQDYLRSNTTDRWASLLTFNGVAAEQTPAYQTIIDIAPIAAPANAGGSLEAVYDYFTAYQQRMVAELSAGSGQGSLPIVAFGAPVRNWIQQQYGVPLAVLGLGRITAAPGQQVSVLGANHPSYIWYAADPANNQGSEEKANQAGIRVMGQDLSAACWQAVMGRQPSADPQQTLQACTQKWQVTDQQQTCVLFFESVRNLPPEQAEARCQQPI
ncbi:hypothetical protein [Pseudomonas sp. NCCP-436]|uniref:hypothetical protein n=1 Tax=Pseudomonas sp. NCCP-436 TaxID=2842481 RepID=UPI001C8025D2|nr:hypothetical protein [Pseudomonas sp. NCCP-436]GIZ11058.1 hypothetical protein NCCP436_04740 [Pseudomonas sp. NCCP-436]